MERSAIEAIRENQAFNIEGVKKTDVPAVIIPSTAKVSSLEHLMNAPTLFKANFNTHIPIEFTNYCETYLEGTSAIYIDIEKMQAQAFFDHGNVENPKWATNKASIQLKKRPPYAELTEKNNYPMDQQQLIDFLTDWKESITLFDQDSQEIPFLTGINRIRKLTISKNTSADIEQGDFKSSASAMESVEIKSGEDKLPAYFVFLTEPYESFEAKKITCMLRAKTDEKSVSLKYRIDALETAKEEIADEFREKINSELQQATVFIGQIELT